ncbi:hypothetical protein OROGR_020311 [Orobanche gracilis]
MHNLRLTDENILPVIGNGIAGEEIDKDVNVRLTRRHYYMR